MNKEFKIKDCFVCNFCREICKGGCNEDLERLEQGIVDSKNKDLQNNRKQRIKCLGKYCDAPCKLQDLSVEVDPQLLINTIKYLGTTLNELLIQKPKQKKEQKKNGKKD